MISSNFAGITENSKPSSKVLRPPGGGSSDIFGTDMPQTPRAVKNHMQSNIFSCEKNSAIKNTGDQPRRAQKNVDSYTRLFGEPERPMTPAKNHQKSSIPFGAKTEAAQQLLANGNGHHNGHHTNGKSGSVSSTSSSVSSSTENLKMMNGISKTATDAACPITPTPSCSTPASSDVLNMDLPCDKAQGEDLSARSMRADVGAGDVSSQTHRDAGCNPQNAHSYSERTNDKNPEQSESCDKSSRPLTPRNPITGLGLGEDGVGGLKPKIPKRRDGNPVTGEGYKPGTDFTTAVPSLNGAKEVINKNRIPPGGYSSGLW